MKQVDFERRLASFPVVEPDAEDIKVIEEAAKEDDSSAISLEEAKQLFDYSGKILLRIPKSLHRDLAVAARREGVSLNQYALYKLSRPSAPQ